MDNSALVSLIVGVLMFISGAASLIISRRKVRSEARTMDADAFAKFQESLTKLQERNDELYQENVALQIQLTELTRTNEQMRIRLEERDAQLNAATKQLDLLRELSKTAPITDTLKAQLEATNRVVENMQAAQADLQRLLREREKAFQELFDSTRVSPKIKSISGS